jgi:hypothetical protein
LLNWFAELIPSLRYESLSNTTDGALSAPYSLLGYDSLPVVRGLPSSVDRGNPLKSTICFLDIDFLGGVSSALIEEPEVYSGISLLLPG